MIISIDRKRKAKWMVSLITCCTLVLAQSCFKEKSIAPPSNQSIGETAQISMGAGYQDQFFYSLETNTVLSQNDRFAYDLMFDCDANRFQVWLNTAKFMSLIKTSATNIDLVSLADTVGKDWRYEVGAYNPDSCAFGQWWDTMSAEPSSANTVYLVHLGLDGEGESLGYLKMQIGNFEAGKYTITYKRDGEATAHTFQVAKDPTRNYAYATFTNDAGPVGNIEPDKALWDFCFTRYTYIFYDPYYLPYSVTGVLNNPSKVQAYMDSTYNFETVTIADFSVSRLSADRDAIGYGWKRFMNNDYTTLPNHIHFIKTGEDYFYKLRFIDFKKGNEWGYPTFEFYRL